MNKIACQYVIVRFAPFVETGEFANVGIVMMAPKVRYFGYKLETTRYARITRFFEGVEARLYRETLGVVREEMDRVHGVLKYHGFDKRRKTADPEFAQRLFAEVVRTRESIVRFSDTRVVLTDDPKQKLKELFAFYVERNFVTKEYKENILVNHVRKWLVQAHLGERFQRMTIGDEEYQANFPFVEKIDRKPVKVIKPLDLAKDKPHKILDHGGAWLFRIEELRRRRCLPGNILFAVQGPGNTGDHCYHAYEEIVGRMKDAGVEVVPYGDKQRVIEFARMQLA